MSNNTHTVLTKNMWFTFKCIVFFNIHVRMKQTVFLISNVHAFSVCVAKAVHVLYMPYGMVNIISSYNAVCAVFAIANYHKQQHVIPDIYIVITLSLCHG